MGLTFLAGRRIEMLEITIKSESREPYSFEWDASPYEFQQLWDDLEAAAARIGRDPIDVANSTIASIAAEGPSENETEARGQKVWIVYAVLRRATENVDFATLEDYAGMINGEPTVFDLVAHQYFAAEISVESGGATTRLTGRSFLRPQFSGRASC
jgi:hypothetical protein